MQSVIIRVNSYGLYSWVYWFINNHFLWKKSAYIAAICFFSILKFLGKQKCRDEFGFDVIAKSIDDTVGEFKTATTLKNTSNRCTVVN